MSAVDLVIFDLDGTLVDTLEDIAAAVNEVMVDLGLPTRSADEYRLFVGEGIRRLLERAIPDHQPLWDRATSSFRRIYADKLVVRSKPYPGIVELLTELERREQLCAVLSNKPDSMTREVIDKLFPAYPFVAVIGMRADVPPKPAPDAAIGIAARADASPGRTLFVGDTPVDIATATAAGMRAIGVNWGFRRRDDLVQQGAEAILDAPADLLALV